MFEEFICLVDADCESNLFIKIIYDAKNLSVSDKSKLLSVSKLIITNFRLFFIVNLSHIFLLSHPLIILKSENDFKDSYEISWDNSTTIEFDAPSTSQISSISTTQDDDDYLYSEDASGDNENVNQIVSETSSQFNDLIDGSGSDSTTFTYTTSFYEDRTSITEFESTTENQDFTETSSISLRYDDTILESSTLTENVDSSTISPDYDEKSSTISQDYDDKSSEISTESSILPEIVSTTPNNLEETTEDEFSDLTLKFHILRIKEVNYTHIIRNQNDVIKSYEKKLLSLQNELEKKEKTIRNLSDVKKLLTKCQSEVRVAKRVVRLEKYSKALIKKLGEFESIDSLQNSDKKTAVRVSNFVVENEDASANILSNNHLFVLPLGLGQMFPNISDLSANCGLVAINSDAFDDLEELRSLNLSGNYITEIETDNFANLIKLRSLDLSNNQITTLQNGSFHDLEELKYLNLARNHIESFPKDLFEDIGALEILILSHNRIRQLQFELLSEINLLQEFHCDNNLLESLNTSIIRNFETALVIDLSSNICIDEHFPKTVSIVQLALMVSEKCKIN